MERLAKPSSELVKTVRQYSLDSALAQGLDQISLLYKVEFQPEEVRLWQITFQGETAQMVEWAFLEYFKSGNFPPKPADILTIIKNKREASEGIPLPRKVCRRCEEHNGFVYVTLEGESRPRVKRCDHSPEKLNAKPAEVPSPTQPGQEAHADSEHAARER